MATKKVASKDDKKKPAKVVSKPAAKAGKIVAKPAMKVDSKTKSAVKADKKKAPILPAVVAKKEVIGAKTKAIGFVKSTDDKAIALKTASSGAPKATEKKTIGF